MQLCIFFSSFSLLSNFAPTYSITQFVFLSPTIVIPDYPNPNNNKRKKKKREEIAFRRREFHRPNKHG